jgi:DNA-binding MarR family transcriptional regulator
MTGEIFRRLKNYPLVKPEHLAELAAELEMHPGYLIRRAQQVSTARFSETYGRFGITPTQATCLHAIHRCPGIDQVAVARVIAIDHATAAMVIATLAAAGYVSRTTDPADRRRKVLNVTRKGAALEKRMGSLADSANELLAPFMKSEAKMLVTLLQRFIEEHAVAKASRDSFPA